MKAQTPDTRSFKALRPHLPLTTVDRMRMSFEAMRALRWLADNPRAAALPEDVVVRTDARSIYDELHSQGLIAETLTMNGTEDGDFDFILTPHGMTVARQVRRAYRAELAQRRVLEWLRTNYSLDGLATDPMAHDFTGSLTKSELDEAASELVDANRLTGHTRADGKFFHLELKPSGRAALRADSPISDPNGRAAGTVTTNTANNYGTIANQVVGGSGHTVTSNVTSGISIEQALEALQQIRESVATAPVDDFVRADVIEDIDGVIAKGMRRGLAWIKQALVPIATHVRAEISQEAAQRITELTSSIIT